MDSDLPIVLVEEAALSPLTMAFHSRAEILLKTKIVFKDGEGMARGSNSCMSVEAAGCTAHCLLWMLRQPSLEVTERCSGLFLRRTASGQSEKAEPAQGLFRKGAPLSVIWKICFYSFKKCPFLFPFKLCLLKCLSYTL